MNIDVSADIKLTDVVDIQTLQRIQNAFAKATGMAALTVDLDGPVTELSNGTDFCMKYTRGNPLGAERCNECDLMGGEEAGRTGRPSVYYCHGGLMDFAAPILLGNRQIGSLIGGQVLPEPADEQKFRLIAQEMGIDEEEYIQALRKIKVVPKTSIQNAAELLYIIGNTLSEIGYQKLQSQSLAQSMTGIIGLIREEISAADSCVTSAAANNGRVIEAFEQLRFLTRESGSTVGETKKVVSYISSLSMQSRLLGMNASVEAAHAGSFGKGFAVIAQEIRSLADNSADQTKKIEEVLSRIALSIDSLAKSMENACSVIEENSNYISKMGEIVKGMDGIADKLASFDQNK